MPQNDNPHSRRVFHFLLALIALPGTILGIAAFFLIIACFAPFIAIKGWWLERRFRRAMQGQQRLIPLSKLTSHLALGQGTLLEEWGPKGVYHVWWTCDELAPSEPAMDFDTRIRALFSDNDGDGFEAARAFNRTCLSQYIGGAQGKASLTTIRPREAKSGSLYRRFPKAQRIIVVPPPFWWQGNRAG